ncbi:MAG: prolyl-tRNA synthetase [Gaiellales bacterium]|jgi:prolyl-tRNA synthetase|nr:prolyl-tRNA synthetase [Gaiellales bacterium]MDX6598018.1 prolyl-tRNA synthetase [Gaiellales bacterium]
MRATRYLLPTLRDAPGDAVAVSHKLLVRAGMVKQVGAGIWTWLPLGWRVERRVQEIIREEMDRIGGQEMLMPVLHPAEIWKRSGRYDIDVVFHLRDRSERELVLAITHEEIVALHASQTIRSYRDLPQIWYHIQLKERDEPRATGGILRTREFTMKDSYTLDRDQAGLDEAYAKHEEAYDRIFTRCGLEFYKVESDTGIMGGSLAHEYMAPSSAGEDRVARCSNCDYAANVEMAVSRIERAPSTPSAQIAEVETPDVNTIDELAQFLGIDPRTTGKAMPVVAADGKVWLALVRGDRRLHELKLSKALRQTTEPATAEQIEAAFGAKPGSIGPVGIRPGGIGGIIADETLREGSWVTGANRTGWHLTGVETPRDFEAVFADLHEVEEGDRCPFCDGSLSIEPMIEIGNIFKLGTRFSEAMGAMYLDESGAEQPIVMGSYGIGPARIAAAAIEQSFDEHGCIWPAPIAPFDVWMVAIGDEAPAHADRLADELAAIGLTSMVDDREGSPGVRFADADLIGSPVRVTVGKRTVSDGTVDVRLRRTGESETVPLDDATARIAALHASLMPRVG